MVEGSGSDPEAALGHGMKEMKSGPVTASRFGGGGNRFLYRSWWSWRRGHSPRTALGAQGSYGGQAEAGFSETEAEPH